METLKINDKLKTSVSCYLSTKIHGLNAQLGLPTNWDESIKSIKKAYHQMILCLLVYTFYKLLLRKLNSF